MEYIYRTVILPRAPGWRTIEAWSTTYSNQATRSTTAINVASWSCVSWTASRGPCWSMTANRSASLWSTFARRSASPIMRSTRWSMTCRSLRRRRRSHWSGSMISRWVATLRRWKSSRRSCTPRMIVSFF